MELCPSAIENMIRQAFPQANVVSHHPLESGLIKQDYVVQLQNPSVQVVLRIYLRDAPHYKIEKEMHLLQVVMPETGVPTARVIHFDDDRTIIDRPYAVLNYLPGEPLEKILPRMDEPDQRAVGYEAGRYLAKLHSIPLAKFGQFSGDDPSALTSEKGYTVARVAEWLDICEENGLLNDSAIVALRHLVGQTPVLDRQKACFVHGGYHGENINVQEGVAGFHVTGVFNFEHAQGWSPEWDMARLLGLVFDDYPALVQGFLDGYADTERLPDNFWDRFEIYQQAMNIYHIVCAHLTGNESSLKMHQARLYRFLASD